MKAFLIFCVVLGHIAYWFPEQSRLLHSTQLWIYSFHMPAFIFLTGLFSKNTVNAKRWDKAVPYIFLYVFMKSLIYLVDVYRFGDKIKIDFFNADGVEWFALALFWWYAITIQIKNAHPIYILITAVCLSIISGYTDTSGSFLVWQRTLVFYPFFYLGYISDAKNLRKKAVAIQKDNTKIILSIVIIIILYIVIYFQYDHISFCLNLFRGNFSYREIFESAPINYLYGGLYRLPAYAISFILIFVLFSIFPDKRITAISYAGAKTLPIYTFHMPMIPLLFTVFSGKLKILMLESNLFFASILFSVLLILITALPFFDAFLKKMMEIPMRGK